MRTLKLDSPQKKSSKSIKRTIEVDDSSEDSNDGVSKKETTKRMKKQQTKKKTAPAILFTVDFTSEKSVYEALVQLESSTSEQSLKKLKKMPFDEKINKLCQHYTPTFLLAAYSAQASNLGIPMTSFNGRPGTRQLINAITDMAVHHRNMTCDMNSIPATVQVSK